MSGTGESIVAGVSAEGRATTSGEQPAAPPRKALKFTTTSKQFVLETENKPNDNKTAVPQLLEQLRPDHAKVPVPNAHSILTPTVFHQPMMPNGQQLMQGLPGMIPMGAMFVGAPQPMGMISPYPMLGAMGMAIPGPIILGPLPAPQLIPPGAFIQAPIHSQQQPMQQFQAHTHQQRQMPVPFIPAGMQMPVPVPENGAHPAQDYDSEEEELTLEEMMKALAEQGELNVSPHVHNQISPGEQAPEEMKMTQDLAAFVSTLTEADYEKLYAAYLEECEGRQEHNFRDNFSDRHTYSGIADYKSESSSDDENEAANKAQFTGVGHPHRWDDDPAAEARRAEIKKSFFKADCSGCECCKGFAMACAGAICASLGVCHCVYRLQCEETGDELDKVFISERQSCECCKGLVYKCVCVAEKKKDNCHCIS